MDGPVDLDELPPEVLRLYEAIEVVRVQQEIHGPIDEATCIEMIAQHVPDWRNLLLISATRDVVRTEGGPPEEQATRREVFGDQDGVGNAREAKLDLLDLLERKSSSG